ncbi:MAG: peroxidase family protein, partial [Rhodovibrionaceae bacterium]|nr:peroxidase family protein [Rhodovibrionaceae bacterium]
RTARSMGAANTQLLRLFEPDYADAVAELSGPFRPSPREISNAVNSDPDKKLVFSAAGLSDYFWQWGQFLNHDIDLTDGVDPPEPEPIPVPAGDTYFDPDFTGTVVIAFNRSIYDRATGVNSVKPREQINQITSFIDASNVYGSDEERADFLRTSDVSGRLKTSEGDLLPFNTAGLPNAGGHSPALFIAGDVRANEQVGLSAMHTLLVREHNRIADEYADLHPEASGDEIYERARRIVAALMQHVTYTEFLPALLGEAALDPYQGYDPDVDASIANSFATAAYRFGHSALPAQLLRIDEKGKEIEEGHLALRDAFFRPDRITQEGGIDPLLRGLAHQVCQEIDVFIIDDVRNFLFGQPGEGGFDLASLNIQRGRDHGLPSYNGARVALGLPPATSFDDITSDPDIRARLRTVYASVDEVDLWVGGLAEDDHAQSLFGETFFEIAKDQFERLRDGDRFWYERDLNAIELDEIRNTRLSDIIRRNTGIGDELPDDVFYVDHGGETPKKGGGGRK